MDSATLVSSSCMCVDNRACIELADMVMAKFDTHSFAVHKDDENEDEEDYTSASTGEARKKKRREGDIAPHGRDK